MVFAHRRWSPFHFLEHNVREISKIVLFSGQGNGILLKFIYSEKATKFCEIFPLLLTVCTVFKNKGKISQYFVAFSKYMNFISLITLGFRPNKIIHGQF